MPAPEIIKTLVHRFHEHSDSLRSPLYNEAQLRQEYLNPFFEALGWDVYNKKEYSIQYREVVHEDSIHTEDSPTAKAPDYAFRLGGVRKFFVEAKKPKEDIEKSKEYAYQLKSYAWSLGLPLSILTDFEEFAVYDCRNKPNLSDSPAASRILYIRYDEYEEKWDEIAKIFSPEGIQRGAFDRYVLDNTAKRGTTKVDDAFLAEIEAWRTSLARNIALRNSEIINERRLNFAVQMTIDRIIFLRICEDRGIEPEKQLYEISSQKEIYSHLNNLFRKADLKYNSGLFHFNVEKNNSDRVDIFTPVLTIDDRVLKKIILSLYYPCPYVFKEIPVEILGQVYEQFLGKVIRLTPGKQAKIEEKPEVRKAGGVYYTPKYIVDYIVANTVGKLLEGKTPREASKLKILDPACGSGSFLLGAFQYLMDWHEKWYQENDLEKWIKGKDPILFYTEKGDLRLSTSEKKRILINNIYGVDIDSQAVEVTKLSLLLKVLEEETGQLTLGFERALPDLGENIKCGNSLIDWDYFQGQLFPDEEEVMRVNPFDWEKNFSDIFSQGGFDAVIGNPPYFSAINFEANIQKYLSNKYSYLWASRNDISYYFLIDGIKNSRKFVSLIIPRYYLNSFYSNNIREFLITQGGIEIVDTENYQCFKNVNILNTIITIDKLKERKIIYHIANNINERINHTKSFIIENHDIDSANWNFSSDSGLLNKISSFQPSLSEYFLIAKGMSTGLNKAFEIIGEDNYLITDKSYIYPLIKNGDIRRYRIIDKGLRNVIYLENVDDIDNLSEYKDYLTNYKHGLKSRKSSKGKWFHYSTPRNQALWEKNGDKIVVPFMATENRFAIEDRVSISTSGDVNALIPIFPDKHYSILYFLGLLNSKALNFYHKKTTKLKRGGYMEYVTNQLAKYPIRSIDFTKSEDVKLHNLMVFYVEHMLELHKRETYTPQEQNLLNRQIAAIDTAIDRLVYELYNLTDEDISIIEENLS